MMRHDQLKRFLTRAVAADLDGRRPPIPECARPLWRAFLRLCETRRYGFAGAEPIAFAEVAAYCATEQVPFEARHIDILRSMDGAFLRAIAAPATAVREDRLLAGSGRPLTASAFDAMWP